MKPLLWSIFSAVAFIGVLFIVFFKNTPHALFSPIPNSFTNLSSKILGISSFWKPKLQSIQNSRIDKPIITASSALSYDLTTDQLLYEKNITEPRPIASLTKIMAAIVALEYEDLKKVIRISKNAATIGENSMGLSVEEKVSLQDLLYGLILQSGNDAAEAIAEGSDVGRENFIYLMNKKAEELGLSDTHFTNASGLEGDGNQYSTAHDLLVITRYGLLHPEFAKIVSTVEYHIPDQETHKEYSLFNETNLLTSYPGVKGVKIGFTYEAGYCIVSYLEYGGHKIIAIILNSGSRRQEMKDLLDYSLKTLGVDPPPHS